MTEKDHFKSPPLRGPLAGRAIHVRDAAALFESDVVTLLAFQPVHGHVVRLARVREVGSFLRCDRRSQLAPRAIAEIGDAVPVLHAALEWKGPLEGVVVVFKDRVHAKVLEERTPETAVGHTRAAHAEPTQKPIRRAVRRIGRNMIDGEEVRPFGSVLEGAGQPVGLISRDGRDVTRIEEDEAQVVAEVEGRVTGVAIRARRKAA